MMPLWFRELARKCRSGPPAPLPARRARARSVLLRLEAVEDRTLASAGLPEPADLLPLPDADAETVTRSPDEVPVPDDVPLPDAPPDRIPLDEVPPADAFGPGLADPSAPATTVDPLPFDPLVQHGRQMPIGLDQRAPADGIPRADAPLSAPGTEVVPPAAEPERDTPARPTTTTGGKAADATPPAAPPSDAAAPGQPAPAARSGPTTNGPPARPLPELVGPTPPARAADAVAPSAPIDAGRPAAELSDGALLQRFAAHREQAAFATLVQRHERFVLAVCQRVLGDPHAAQDAMQATFLVLARKAGMLDRQTPLGGWLYKVAYHVSLRLRGVSARQRRTEAEAAAERIAAQATDGPAEVERQEIREAVREELRRLPEKYRTPLELCYIDGRTHAEAAREIGLPRGSMAKRVGEGLDRLRERLEVRGVTL